MYGHFIISGLLGFIAAFLLTKILIRVSPRWGLLDKPGGRKRHDRPIPFTGGYAIFLGFWLSFLVAMALQPEFRSELSHYLWTILAAHSVLFLGGLLDDLCDFRAITKLLIQTLAAVLLIKGGLKIDTIFVPFTGSFLLGDLTYPVTILWVMLIVNAVNIIDGLDGLAGGLSLITALGLLYTAFVLHIPVVGAMAILLVGVLLAFLRFNFRNATIFMGNSGSQSIGFIIALAAIYCPIKSYTVVAMFIPLLSLGVPLLELVFTFFRRFVTGRPVMVGDRGHLFHLLIDRGIGKTSTVLVFYAIAFAFQVFVFTLFLFDRRIVFSILVMFMAIVASWFFFVFRRGRR